MKDDDITELWSNNRVMLLDLQNQAEEQYQLRKFGDFLAEREGYRYHSGIQAIRYFLMQRHHWLPATTRALSWEDLQFAMAEEIEASGWRPGELPGPSDAE